MKFTHLEKKKARYVIVDALVFRHSHVFEGLFQFHKPMKRWSSMANCFQCRGPLYLWHHSLPLLFYWVIPALFINIYVRLAVLHSHHISHGFALPTKFFFFF